MRGTFVVVLSMIVLATAGEARADKVLVVLPLDVITGDAQPDPNVRISIAQMLRNISQATLTDAGWTVLSSDAAIQLKNDPTKCDEACHETAAREISAEKTLGGTIRSKDDKIIVSLNVTVRRTHRTLTDERLEGPSVKILEGIFEGDAQAFFERGGLLPSTQTQPPVTDIVLPTWTYVPGGTFVMGEPGRSDLTPTHVIVSPYYMNTTEVSVAEYRSCVSSGVCAAAFTSEAYPGVGARPYRNDCCNWRKVGRENHPINCVSWEQARQYCGSIGGRLPTEAEWEFAGGGTDGRRYPWGNTEPDANVACFAGTCSSTVPVTSYPRGASPFGLLNMIGNVDEWTEDGDAPLPGGSVTNPTPPNNHWHIIRGGGWDMDVFEVRGFRAVRGTSAWLGEGTPFRTRTLGFRCVRDAR